MQFIWYSKCSTCQSAKKFLDSHHFSYDNRSIVEDVPTISEIKNWISKYSIDLKKLFNTSGMKYRELHLKEKLPFMTDDEKIALLASDGMLMKRPILVSSDFILVGFSDKEYKKKLQ